MKKVISVTKTDIKRGQQGECNACPVALAVMRAFKGSCMASVYAKMFVYFQKSRGKGDTYFESFGATTPKAAREFMHQFDVAPTKGDAIKNLKPFTFTADFTLLKDPHAAS